VHWVSKEHSVDAVVRIYNYLFTAAEMKDDWINYLNPESMAEMKNAKVWEKHSNDHEGDRY
jgi:hypothetical protein